MYVSPPRVPRPVAGVCTVEGNGIPTHGREHGPGRIVAYPETDVSRPRTGRIGLVQGEGGVLRPNSPDLRRGCCGVKKGSTIAHETCLPGRQAAPPPDLGKAGAVVMDGWALTRSGPPQPRAVQGSCSSEHHVGTTIPHRGQPAAGDCSWSSVGHEAWGRGSTPQGLSLLSSRYGAESGEGQGPWSVYLALP